MTTTIPPPLPHECAFYIPRKQRYCRLKKLNEKDQFCKEHGDSPKCPLCFHNLSKPLESHLKVCTKKPVPPPDWYSSNLHFKVQSESNAKEIMRNMTLDEFNTFYSRVKEWAPSTLIPTEILLHSSLKEKCDSCTIGKHAYQQASLLGQLEKMGYLFPCNFIEFGCGKAEMTRWVHQVVNGGFYYLVDRQQQPLKLNFELKSSQQYQRVIMDIKDLDLNKLIKDQEPLVVYSKHLCGVATDLSLRCLFHSKLKVHGMVIALCCHHLCHYDGYIAPDYLEELGIDRLSFDLMCLFSSWATCAFQEQEHWSGLKAQEREAFGLLCKQILNQGRLRALEKHGFSPRLVQYIQKDKSLENIALIV